MRVDATLGRSPIRPPAGRFVGWVALLRDAHVDPPPSADSQPRPLSASELDDLRFAKALLEHPSLAARVTGALGLPLERGFALLPVGWRERVLEASRAALERALDAALQTLGEADGGRSSRDRFHKLLVAATGGVGGAFGLGALALELPLSTTLMLRSIADIARSEGESLARPEVRLECLSVFALGGRGAADDAAETGYYALRATLAKALSEAAALLGRGAVGGHAAPPLVTFLSKVATRFGVTVSEKAAAQALPIVGAAGGALVNTLFIDHFQGVARGHFIVRRLERAHGAEAVRALWRES